jgi:exosortase C (VPDSG-CTERM-specific)
VQFASGNELYSYILLIPFVSLYLARINKKSESVLWKPGKRGAFTWFLIGVLSLVGLLGAMRHGWKPNLEDYLAVMMIAFLCFFVCGAFLCLGSNGLRRVAFPVCFLIFIIPFPSVLRDSIESFLQHRSADVAQALLSLAGMPVLRHDTVFLLPGFALEVAPECSGVHSTVVLFITSLVAGYLFLKNPWWRALLTAAVIPLALLRNGFRIFTVSELCVNVDHGMINSYIHRKGGPIFFALSLIPFLLLLFLLRKCETRKRRPTPGSNAGCAHGT